MKSTINITVSFCLFFLLSVILVGQEKLRTLEKRITKNDPIELVSFEVKNRVFNDKKTVVGDKFWLRDLRMNVRNISNKQIVYLSVNIQIQPTSKSKIPFNLPFVFGSYYLPEQGLNYKPFMPNETLKIAILPTQLEYFTNVFMPQNDLNDIDFVKYYFNFIVFEDGTAWSKGRLLHRSQNNPYKWESFSNKSNPVIHGQNFYSNLILASFLKLNDDSPIFQPKNLNPSFFLQVMNQIPKR